MNELQRERGSKRLAAANNARSVEDRADVPFGERQGRVGPEHEGPVAARPERDDDV